MFQPFLQGPFRSISQLPLRSAEIPLPLSIQMPVTATDFDIGPRDQFPDQVDGLMQLPGAITGNIEDTSLDILRLRSQQHGTHDVFDMDIVEAVVAAGRE
ncbi:hypothetical protein D3C85_1215080 [compost metagenome]